MKRVQRVYLVDAYTLWQLCKYNSIQLVFQFKTYEWWAIQQIAIYLSQQNTHTHTSLEYECNCARVRQSNSFNENCSFLFFLIWLFCLFVGSSFFSVLNSRLCCLKRAINQIKLDEIRRSYTIIKLELCQYIAAVGWWCMSVDTIDFYVFVEIEMLSSFRFFFVSSAFLTLVDV